VTDEELDRTDVVLDLLGEWICSHESGSSQLLVMSFHPFVHRAQSKQIGGSLYLVSTKESREMLGVINKIK
jgi:hypothetical protein